MRIATVKSHSKSSKEGKPTKHQKAIASVEKINMGLRIKIS